MSETDFKFLPLNFYYFFKSKDQVINGSIPEVNYLLNKKN